MSARIQGSRLPASPQPATLGAFLESVAARYGSRTALSVRPRYRTLRWSYAALHEESGRVADLLQRRGVGPGDRVVLWAPNSPWWVAAFFGIVRAGAVVVPLDVRCGAPFVERVVAQSTPSLAITSRIDAVSALGETPRVDLEDMVEALGPRDAPTAVVVTAESLAEIVYTSGTTGHPKGVMLTHRNVLANVDSVARVLPTGEHRLLSLLPLSHMFEQTIGLLLPLSIGAYIHYPISRQPSVVLRALNREHTTTVVAVPQVLALFMDAIEGDAAKARPRAWRWMQKLAPHLSRRMRRVVFSPVHRRLGGRLTLLVSGGAPLAAGLGERWERIGIPVLQGYGVTEAAPCVATTTLDANRAGTVGRPLPGVDVRLGPDGEIMLRGANIFGGYWNNPSETARSFVDGWYRTGDLGTFDAAGYLTLLGRKKNMIVLDDGQNVYPEDVEEALRLHGSVRDAVVLGEQTARGTRLTAVVILDGSSDPEALLSSVNRELTPHQRLSRVQVWPDDDFPRTHTLKVRRDDVVARLRGDDASAAGAVLRRSDPETASPLVALVARVANRPPGGIDDTTTLADLDLDSLGRVALLSTIEDELGVYVDEAGITDATTVGDLRRATEGARAETRPSYPTWPRSAPAGALRRVAQRGLFALLAHFVTIEVHGARHLDGVRGPVIVVANHSSHLDTLTILRALPTRISARIAVAAAADYFFTRRVLALAVAAFVNAFPFARRGAVGPTLDQCSVLLEAGWSLLLYPEGTRTTTGAMGPFQDGVGLLAREVGVRVVPLKVVGLFDILPKGASLPRAGSAQVYIGAPIEPDAAEGPAELTARIEEAVRCLGPA